MRRSHARRRRRLRHFVRRTLHIVIETWTDSAGRIEYRMGYRRGSYYIEKQHAHFPGLAGLTERRQVSKADALAFTPELWLDNPT